MFWLGLIVGVVLTFLISFAFLCFIVGLGARR